MPEHFFRQLESHALHQPEAHALRAVSPDSQVSGIGYRELWSVVESLAAEVDRKYPPGAAVTLCLPNGIEFVTTFLGVLRAGRTVVPFHPASTQGERRVEVPLFDGPSLVLKSSGTTGLPKAVRRDGPSLDAVTRNVAAATGMTQRDRVLAVIPQCHSYGIENVLLAPLWAGACIVLCEGFDPSQVLRLWRESAVTVLPGVPFMFEVLATMGHANDAEGLRLAYSAGGPLPRSVSDAFLAKHGLHIGQLYGATEIGSVTFNDPAREGFDPSSVGLPMAGVELRVVGEEGQVAVRAPSMMRGYLDGDAEELRDGFFLTGDLGRLDYRGALTITGRLKLLIDVGGMKVNPLEVEAVLCEHPSVKECVVVPVKQSATVVRLKAVVVAREGAAVDPEELRRAVKLKLAGYKVPRIIEVRASLPKSATGKVRRHELIEEGGT